MLSKLFRIFILLIITSTAARTARQTQRAVYSVLVFQVSGYELLLETKQSMQGITTTAKNTYDNAKWFFEELFNETKPWKAERLNDTDTDIQTKIDTFRTKLVRISWTLAWVVGVIVRKILFDLVFGLKTLIVRIHRFIRE